MDCFFAGRWYRWDVKTDQSGEHGYWETIWWREETTVHCSGAGEQSSCDIPRWANYVSRQHPRNLTVQISIINLPVYIH